VAGGSVHDVSAEVAQAHAPHVLIVEDDADVAALVTTYLRGQGLHVECVQSGHALFETVSREPVDVVLLDLGLPGEDGLAILRELRGRWRGPVIIVSGRGEAVERVVGLELGADDYVAKPFDFRELLARIRSVLRRVAAPAQEARDESVLLFNGMRLEPAKRRLVRDDGSEIHLSAGEFALLSILASRPGHVFSRDALMSRLHGHDAGPYDRAIDVQVGRLRRKIEGDALHPQVIKSIRGAGYVFSASIVRAPA
jgi:two-component system, OmpR family, response regulator